MIVRSHPAVWISQVKILFKLSALGRTSGLCGPPISSDWKDILSGRASRVPGGVPGGEKNTLLAVSSLLLFAMPALAPPRPPRPAGAGGPAIGVPPAGAPANPRPPRLPPTGAGRLEGFFPP